MRTIAVIGAGFSGSMVAAGLLRAGGTRVLLFERRAAFGPGLAYSTPCAAHLLNVPVGRMSAFPDEPDDFLRWGLAQGHAWTGGTFAPRREYGRYLQDTLNAAEALARAPLVRISGEVVACRHTPDGFHIEWTAPDGSPRAPLAAEAAVLALGNFPPAHPAPMLAALEPALYAPDPWADAALDGIEPTSPVLLVGTGLTMLDVVLSLLERGHRAPIHALSRRALLPQPHRAHPRPANYTPPPGVDRWQPTAAAMLRNVRREIAAAGRRGVDWREVITSLRAVTPSLWRSLPLSERARFLRHLRPYWEVVRHRSAPSVDGRIQELMMDGRLSIHAGRLVGAEPAPGGIDARLAPRSGGVARSIRVARIVNCTGPRTDPARAGSALLTQLLSDGMAKPDPLGQGVATDEAGRVLSADGPPTPGLWLVGPMAKGAAWEITAVPELRGHAASVAAALAPGMVSAGA